MSKGRDDTAMWIVGEIRSADFIPVREDIGRLGDVDEDDEVSVGLQCLVTKGHMGQHAKENVV
jgi:hypothetical protein